MESGAAGANFQTQPAIQTERTCSHQGSLGTLASLATAPCVCTHDGTIVLAPTVPHPRVLAGIACSDGTAAGFVGFRITRSLGARLNIASDTPLHCPRRTKLTQSIEQGFDAPAQNFGPSDRICYQRLSGICVLVILSHVVSLIRQISSSSPPPA